MRGKISLVFFRERMIKVNSYWIDSVKKNKKEFSKLSEDLTTDVCIIGGGITGLTTAYYLSKTSLKTVVLEKYKICEHTTRKFYC